MSRSGTQQAPPTKLLPIPVLPFAPVRQDERQHYLKLLYQQYRITLPNDKQAIATTVTKEYDMACHCKSRMEYMGRVKKVMFNLKKYGNDKGKVKGVVAAEKPSVDELFRRLSKLCISKESLISHGFVTQLPETLRDDEVDDVMECQHCHNMFSRSDQFSPTGESKETTVCKFHPGKMLIETDSNILGGRRVGNRAYTNRYYTCCHELRDQTEGCRQLDKHVFKPSDPRMLHWLKPFQHIDALRKSLDIRDDERSQVERRKRIKAIGIDCEMCFTDVGFEVMKVSAVDFHTMRPILNNLVVPDGQTVIDLNSHVSGVNSVPVASDPGTLTFDELMVKMAQLTDKNTIVIGHGLENDLNVLRLIYPRIVDTAILFSENQLDPMRKDPLKKLAWKYLSKNIQQSEHDPLEDAIIPVEIVKKVLESKKYA